MEKEKQIDLEEYSPNVIKRAEAILNNEETGCISDEPITIQEIVDEPESERELKRIRRLLRISEGSERQGENLTEEEKARAFVKVEFDARRLFGGEKNIFNKAYNKVANFVALYKDELPSQERVAENTLVYLRGSESKKNTHLASSKGNYRGILLDYNFLHNDRESGGLVVHELVHYMQDKQVPRGLLEGGTTIYTERILKKNNDREFLKAMKKATLKNGYIFEKVAFKLIEKVVGEEVMARAFFNGEYRNLIDSYNSKVKGVPLDARLRQLQYLHESNQRGANKNGSHAEIAKYYIYTSKLLLSLFNDRVSASLRA